MLIEGAPGVGKTRLLNALREQAAADGMRVLSARCSELERLFPFGVVRKRLLEGTLAALGVRAQALSGAAAPAETLFGGAPDSAAADVSFTTLHALYWLVLNLAERAGRCCSRSTTCSGATAPRCGSSPTSPRGSTGSRSCSPRRCAPARPAATPSCSARSRPRRSPRRSARRR